METLTEKQLRMFIYVKGFIKKSGKSPLLREVQNGCKINSYKTVVDRLMALEKRGYISREQGKHRGIKCIV
jgi:repressor LexA